jgi:hypothetical protein
LNKPKTIIYYGPIDSDNRYTIFESIDFPFLTLKGDVNEDSVINVLDVLAIVNFFFEDVSLSEVQQWAIDFNSDNNIDITDIVFLVSFIFAH